jgi:hypothetical protein
MRKFRAIVQSKLEPQDHEVIWNYKGKLLYWEDGWQPLHSLEASEISYQYEEAKEVENTEQALNKLLYVEPEIVSFKLKQEGTHMIGSKVESLDFSWEYNKDTFKEQYLNGEKIPISVREYHIDETVTEDTTFHLSASDGTKEVIASTSIDFKPYIHYGPVPSNNVYFAYTPPSTSTLTVYSRETVHISIFIPNGYYNTIWWDNMNVTSDFEAVEYTTKQNDIEVNGILYTSKNSGLGILTLKLT